MVPYVVTFLLYRNRSYIHRIMSVETSGCNVQCAVWTESTVIDNSGCAAQNRASQKYGSDMESSSRYAVSDVSV